MTWSGTIVALIRRVGLVETGFIRPQFRQWEIKEPTESWEGITRPQSYEDIFEIAIHLVRQRRQHLAHFTHLSTTEQYNRLNIST